MTSFTLINADSDAPIAGFDPLASGATLNLATLPTRNLNVRANASGGTIRSVRFALDGNANFRIENVAPYALAGDTSGNYEAWTPSTGSHSLQATPYSGGGATGTAGTSKTITFTVVDSAAATAAATAEESASTLSGDSSGDGAGRGALGVEFRRSHGARR